MPDPVTLADNLVTGLASGGSLGALGALAVRYLIKKDQEREKERSEQLESVSKAMTEINTKMVVHEALKERNGSHKREFDKVKETQILERARVDAVFRYIEEMRGDIRCIRAHLAKGQGK